MVKKFILWFDQISINDVSIVGGKNASLGEMYKNLTKYGIKIPNGFAITTYAFHYFLKNENILDRIKKVLTGLDVLNIKGLKKRGREVRQIILNAEMPKELNDDIIKAYYKLSKQYGNNCDVAVRSSATTEDLATESFAGLQETYLNIKGKAQLLKACKKCFASLFTDRAISYRASRGYDHFSIALSIGIQKMVRSDTASSGVIFTIDTESGFKDVVFITSSYGLGENIVKGIVNPDEFYVFKPTLNLGFRPILSKNLGDKRIKMVYNKGSKSTKNILVSKGDREKYSLTDKEILKLANWACIIEDYYSKKAGHFKPMDIEWAKDGKTKELFIVQARPETIQSQKNKDYIERFVLKEKGRILIKGDSVGDKISNGKIRVIKDVRKISNFNKGEILVTDMTDPNWEPIMKIANGIITNRGGRTSHAAILSREFGIPCIIGTNNATEVLKTGQNVTIDCSQGEIGYVYDKILKYNIKKINLKKLPKTKTKIMMNIGIPETAFEQSFIPNDGVGLARLEFIINSYIGIHPLALCNFNKLKDKRIKDKINKIVSSYDKINFFIDKLAQGISKIAAAFYPKEVIVRLSDFKSNEYAELIGGKFFEPKEENPIIGWRGASRYYSTKYKEAFALECKALLKVRNEMGLINVKIMIPFCRTIEEGKKVLKKLERNGLKRGKNKLEIYVMCEIPSNVILADKFAEIFDGFSIGSNDLTMLCLGLDRDSEIVSNIADERNEAVKRLISQVIKIAREKRCKIGICGQAPSDFPEFAQFLVKLGIDSISLNADTIIETRLKIVEMEKKLGFN